MSSIRPAKFIEERKSERHAVDHVTIAEHKDLGEIPVRIVNISQQGFMVRGGPRLEQGARIRIRLPFIGIIEGHLAWSHGDRSGFQLERLIRPDDFNTMLSQLGPSSTSV